MIRRRDCVFGSVFVLVKCEVMNVMSLVARGQGLSVQLLSIPYLQLVSLSELSRFLIIV